MIAGCVYIGMTASTIRHIRWEWPGDNLIVGFVTVDTEYGRPMVTRVTGRVMPEPY